MSRRGYPLRWTCVHDGCREQYYSVVDYKADYQAAWKRQSENPWLCLRHNGRGDVLSPTNTRIRTEVPMTVEKYGQFWDHNGFVHAPGFKAWANDFPEGTTLIVTAEVVLPAVGDVRDGGQS